MESIVSSAESLERQDGARWSGGNFCLLPRVFWLKQVERTSRTLQSLFRGLRKLVHDLYTK